MFAFYPLGSDAVWSVGIKLLQFFFALLEKCSKPIIKFKKGLGVVCFWGFVCILCAF